MAQGYEIIKATLPFVREQPLRSWWCLISTMVLFAACLIAAVIFLPGGFGGAIAKLGTRLRSSASRN